jgi:hypothetical protein
MQSSFPFKSRAERVKHFSWVQGGRAKSVILRQLGARFRFLRQ